jgi:DNA-binding CsgD family transcriptional regulator
LLEQGDTLGLYTLWRSEEMRPFSRADVHFLGTVAPHITHAVKTAKLPNYRPPVGNVFERSLDSPIGVALMSFDGRVLALNKQAESMFQQIGVFDRLRNDRLALGVQIALDHIARMMHAIFHEVGDSAETAAPATRTYSHWCGLTLSMRGFATDGSVGEKCFVVFIEQSESQWHKRHQIMHRYGLIQREMEFLGLITRGLSRREIAERMAITTGTLKTYSDRIADKLLLSRANGLRAFACELRL